MKYQIIKHNKTNSRTMAVCDTLDGAVWYLKKRGIQYNGISYMGGFPTFLDDKQKQYSIQGSVQVNSLQSIVCSIPKKDLEMLGFVG